MRFVCWTVVICRESYVLCAEGVATLYIQLS